MIESTQSEAGTGRPAESAEPPRSSASSEICPPISDIRPASSDVRPPSSDIAIEVEGLTKSFDGRVVVRGLTMRVRRGLIYGFLGPNGSGKTTTIRMLCGLLTPDSGRGTCLGFDILTEAEKIKRHVGYMTQRFSLYEDLSVRENLEFIARIYGVRDPRRAAREAIAHLGLTGRENQTLPPRSAWPAPPSTGRSASTGSPPKYDKP